MPFSISSVIIARLILYLAGAVLVAASCAAVIGLAGLLERFSNRPMPRE